MEARLPGSREPSCVYLIEEALERADDFMTAHQLLQAVPTLKYQQVSAALSHLRKNLAADFVEAEAKLWWYLTPETDRRCRKVVERLIEEPGHRKSRARAKPRSPSARPISSKGGFE